MVPAHDPIVVYAMVAALIVALAVGIFFASPLRSVLTGPDEPADPPSQAPEPPSDEPERPQDGPWSTSPPTPDPNWPTLPSRGP